MKRNEDYETHLDPCIGPEDHDGAFSFVRESRTIGSRWRRCESRNMKIERTHLNNEIVACSTAGILHRMDQHHIVDRAGEHDVIRAV
jgi:hypothetical protein